MHWIVPNFYSSINRICTQKTRYWKVCNYMRSLLKTTCLMLTLELLWRYFCDLCEKPRKVLLLSIYLLCKLSVHFHGVLLSLAFPLHFFCWGLYGLLPNHGSDVNAAPTLAAEGKSHKCYFYIINSWCTYKFSKALFYVCRPYLYYCRSLVQFHAFLVR